MVDTYTLGTRRRILRWAGTATLMLATLGMPGVVAAADDDGPPVPVVVTFSILGDMVEAIGGENVEVTSLIGRNVDAHSFVPAPDAAQVLAGAQLFVSNGLGFEPWLPAVLQAAGFDGTSVVASDGVTPRRFATDGGTSGGRVDPHAWHDLKNGMKYAENIADGLAVADPKRASYYQRRLKKYVDQMRKLDDELRSALKVIPVDGRKAITLHDAFGYFGRAYGIQFIPAAGLGSQKEPAEQDIEALVEMARADGKTGLFIEGFTSAELIEALTRDADVPVSGPLYSDALAAVDEPAGTYLGMFHWNAGQLISVFKASNGT